jgi:hypothetical protein
MKPTTAFALCLALLAALPVLISALLVAQSRWGVLPGVNPARDPTVDTCAWDQVAQALRRRGFLGAPRTFLFTTNWASSAQLAFATASRVPVLCYHPDDARGFAYWSAPGQWVGFDGILVSRSDRPDEAAALSPWFTRIEPLGEVAVRRGGRVVRRMRITRCLRQTRPFPFGNLPPGGAVAPIPVRAARALPVTGSVSPH